MHGFFMIFFTWRTRAARHPIKLNMDDTAKHMTEFELKDIVINRIAGGKMITAARKELERRGISLTDSEKQLQEAKKQERIRDAQRI